MIVSTKSPAIVTREIWVVPRDAKATPVPFCGREFLFVIL